MHVAYSRDKVYKDVGSRRQLFIDNDVIAVVKNVTRRQHSPEKHPDNPLIQRDKPWEGIPYFRSSTFNVLRDPADGLFKCWYSDFYEYFGKKQITLDTLLYRIYYAQSEDGLNWEKPALGKHFVDGHDTNTVLGQLRDELIFCPSVFTDPRDSDPSRRYKTVYLARFKDPTHPKASPYGYRAGGLCMAVSPDGIDWTPDERNPVISEWLSDVQILTYDPDDEKYVLWGRYGGFPGSGWFAPVWPSKPEGIWGTRRRIYRMESKDLYEWSEAELIWDPDENDNLDDSHYGFVPWRADEMHLGLLNVLHQVDDTLDMYLHFSRDGIDWQRFLDHRPFIRRGGEGSYDRFDIETPTQPLVVGDELWIYYGGMNVHHDWWILGKEEGLDVPEAHDPSKAQNGHHLCLATMRLDGYVSLDATVREGWIETKPVFSAAKRLYINGRCESDGYIEVEVMDSWNNVWEEYARDKCETFTGDSVRHQVKWSGRETVSDVPGALKLRFHLRNAELYGFQFA